jgi:hypothetical protein
VANCHGYQFTAAISRVDLTRDCLQELRMWFGCETGRARGIGRQVYDSHNRLRLGEETTCRPCPSVHPTGEAVAPLKMD